MRPAEPFASTTPRRLRDLPWTEIGGHRVPVADGWLPRLLGLALLDRIRAGPGLMIPRCRSVHSFGMRFALDVAFLDRAGSVIAHRRAVPPGRVLVEPRAWGVLEVPSAPRTVAYDLAVAAGWHLAQVNIAIPREPIDSPALAEFVALLEPINAIADTSPGFVWRLQDESGDATAIRPFEDERIMINMSVWESVESLWKFVYDSRHLDVMRRRREWFTRMADAYMCLWWIPAGDLPSLEDARERTDYLRAHGPSQHAFTFKKRFGPPDSGETDPVLDDRAPCPAG